MKMNKIITAVLLILLLTVVFCGCAKNSNTPTEATQESIFEIKELVETQAPEKGSIEEYFDRCSELSLEAGKEIRVSSDVWQQEEVGDNQVKYTSLGGSVVNTVVYDTEEEKVISVSSSVLIENYLADADTEIMGVYAVSQTYNASVFTAAMIEGDSECVKELLSDFMNVVASGVEMYKNNVKLSTSSDENYISLNAELTE